jgi:DNA-binding MarR family transcriptional regulator
MDDDAALVDAADDVGLLCQVIATATAERVLRELGAAGFADVRASHGYVFEGLLAGDVTSTELAHRLGVSVQAVSKSVSELEAAGYLARRRDEHDGRARAIELTPRATAMLAASRRARADLRREVVDRLGERDAARLTELLRSVCDLHGGLDLIASRRLRPTDGLG